MRLIIRQGKPMSFIIWRRIGSNPLPKPTGWSSPLIQTSLQTVLGYFYSLTQFGLWHSMVTKIWVNIGPDTHLLPDVTKQLSEPILNYLQYQYMVIWHTPVPWLHWKYVWCHQMETFLCEESTGHRWIPLTKPVTRSSDVFFDLCLNKMLSKQYMIPSILTTTTMLFLKANNSIKTHWGRDKMTAICRHFQMHFLEWKL